MTLDTAAVEVATRLQAWLDASVADFKLGVPVVMPNKKPATPPWISKSRVNRAGEALRGGAPSPEDAAVVDAWRGAHTYVLNTFQALLRNRTRGTGVTVAQRLKRRTTIIDKMEREPRMQLARMDDIAGCRLIFSSIRSLRHFREKFHASRIRHKRRNDLDKYNYIKTPKPLGYRGIHDIFEYNVRSTKGQAFNGLQIEIQYRTKHQHAWATAVELVERLTANQPKFNRGDPRYIEFFKLASEVIARTGERMRSVFPDLTDREVVRRVEEIDGEIHIMDMLSTVVPSGGRGDGKARIMILQVSPNGRLITHVCASIEDATAALFRLEKDNPDDDIVLVAGDTLKAIRSAYRNYFSDVSEFIRYMEEGCKKLRASPLEAPPQMRLDFGTSRNDEILGSMRAMRRAHLK
jgi:putative GTP pyrophosphokinase